MTYLDNVNGHIEAIGSRSLKQRDGKAWDNAKTKAAKIHRPRGKVFNWLYRQEHSRKFKDIVGG